MFTNVLSFLFFDVRCQPAAYFRDKGLRNNYLLIFTPRAILSPLVVAARGGPLFPPPPPRYTTGSVKTTNFMKSFIMKSFLVTNSFILLVVELPFCISTFLHIGHNANL